MRVRDLTESFFTSVLKKRQPGKLHFTFFTNKVSTIIYTDEG